MSGPVFLRFVGPILAVLGEIGGAGRASEVTDLVLERMAIPDEELAQTNRNGGSRVRNQVAWARMYLVNDGLLDSSRRGTWALTDRARGLSLNADDVLALFKRVQKGHRGRAEHRTEPLPANAEMSLDDEAAPPEGPTTVREELLELLRQLPPEGFERLCQRLLREAGFERVVVTGRSSDGGIDGHGLLQINPFVSFKVLFQCKRYSGSVSSPQVRDFRGAMAGRADKGLLLTTGSFTADARKEAHRDGVHPIELVDGDQLVEMFEKYELGLRSAITFQLDRDFFVAFGSDAG